MVFASHLKFCDFILNEYFAGDERFEKYRKFIELGSVAPDVKCVFPKHRIDVTRYRFIKRIERVEKCRGFIRAFWIGVVFHYICDYFCLAHNSLSIKPGFEHTCYELSLNKELKRVCELPDSELKVSPKFLQKYRSEFKEFLNRAEKEYPGMLSDDKVLVVFSELRELCLKYRSVSLECSDMELRKLCFDFVRDLVKLRCAPSEKIMSVVSELNCMYLRLSESVERTEILDIVIVRRVVESLIYNPIFA